MVTLVKNEVSRSGLKITYLKTTLFSESNALYFKDLSQTVCKWQHFSFRHHQVFQIEFLLFVRYVPDLEIKC